MNIGLSRSRNVGSRITSLKNILIIYDGSDITSALKARLENYHEYNVNVINDPIFAISNYKSEVYDLIIPDVRMPKNDGFELFRIRNPRQQHKDLLLDCI